MNEKYIFLATCDGEHDDPILYGTRDEALAALKADIIEAMNGKDESIFDDYEKGEEYDWDPDWESAWYNHRHGKHEWVIFTIDEFLQWVMGAKKAEAPDNAGPIPLTVAFTIDLKPEDIDDIMCSALEGGICYWCSKAEVVGDYLGEYAHEQISRGGTLLLHDAENNDKYELTRDKFLKGLRLFLGGGHSDLVNIKNNSIDPGEFDGNCADMIVQLGLFGKVIYA